MRHRGSNNKFEKQDLSYADLDESSLKHTKPAAHPKMALLRGTARQGFHV
jgi:hypothetical protein